MSLELKKSLNIFQGIGLAVCMVVGSGLLGLPGLVIDTGGVFGSSVGWLLISVLCIPLIHMFSKLGLQFPNAAGLSNYSKVAAGEWASFGVSIVLVGTFVICIPVGTMIGATYIKQLFSLDISAVWIAVSILILVTIINIAGVRASSFINMVSVGALFSLVGVIIFRNFNYVTIGVEVFTDTITGKYPIEYSSVWKVCAMLFWGYLGWENLSFGLEEFKNPRKNVPIVFWSSYIIVVAFYLGLASVSIGSEYSGAPVRGAAGLVGLIGKGWIRMYINLIMIIIVFANVNSWVFGASRLVFSTGREGILPKLFSGLSSKSIPYASLIALLVAYIIITIIFLSNKEFLPKLLILANQNFIVLYGFCIFAYWKTTKTYFKIIITILSAISCSFLLSGFGVTLLYPLALLAIGYIIYKRKNSDSKAVKSMC